jgi:hypothetical protein
MPYVILLQGFEWKQNKRSVVSHCDLAIYMKKDLKAKEELWYLKYFTMLCCCVPKKKNLNKI